MIFLFFEKKFQHNYPVDLIRDCVFHWFSLYYYDFFNLIPNIPLHNFIITSNIPCLEKIKKNHKNWDQLLNIKDEFAYTPQYLAQR